MPTSRVRRACAMVPFVLLLPIAADAAEATPPEVTPPPTLVHVETDPATFVLSGFSAHARVRPAATPRWSFGAGVYALTMPGLMVDLDPANRGLGWSSRITFAAGAFVDRYFREDGEGAFLGVQLGAQRFRVTRDAAPGQASFTNVLVMPRVGYLLRPFDAGFYVMPWVGVGATARVAGEVKVGGERYDVLPVVAFATLHAGWRF